MHLAWLTKKSVAEVLEELKSLGLDSLTGGGAEIFQQEVRDRIARGKETAEEYLDVHRTWHRLGVTAPARCCSAISRRWPIGWITCGSCASCRMRPEASPVHPLPYQPENNEIPVKHPPTGLIPSARWRWRGVLG